MHTCWKCGARKFAPFKSGLYACRHCGNANVIDTSTASFHLVIALIMLLAVSLLMLAAAISFRLL
jgi:hypothetical protein